MDKKINDTTVEIIDVIPQKSITRKLNISALLRKKEIIEEQLLETNSLIQRFNSAQKPI